MNGSGEVIRVLSQSDAERLTEQIRETITAVDDGMDRLRGLLDEARGSNVWQVLGFRSWTEYLADLFEGRPVRLSRGDRRELVGLLSSAGMSSRTIAPIVGVDRATVQRDISVGAFAPTESEPTESPAPRVVTGSDGKTYTAQPKPRPATSDVSSNATSRDGMKSYRELQDEKWAKIRALAEAGRTSHQIATEVGLTIAGLMDAAKRRGVTFPADRYVARTRRIRPLDVLERVISSLEADENAIRQMVTYEDVTPEMAADWLARITEPLRAINQMKRQLKDLCNE